MSFFDDIKRKCPSLQIETDVPMGRYTTFRAGGNAAYFICADDLEQLTDALACVKEYGVPFMILGNGSDLLFRDEGYRGAVIRLGRDFDRIEADGERISAGAAVLMSRCARTACDLGLTGMEFMSGIPGSIGGGVYMNAGAYGGEISQTIESAVCLTADGNLITVNASDMEMAYRHTVFMTQKLIILKAVFSLKKGDTEEIRALMRDLNERRREKQPLEYPSAGSFFKRPEGHFAGALIEQCGLKGIRIGGAQVSDKHAGFIINRQDASAGDILALMELVQEKVYDRFGVRLEPEVMIIGGKE